MHDVLGLWVTCDCNAGMQRQEHLPGFWVIDIQVPQDSLPFSTTEKVERNEEATQPELLASIYICIHARAHVCTHRRRIICNITVNSLIAGCEYTNTLVCPHQTCLHSMLTISATASSGSMARSLRTSSILVPAFPLNLCLLIHLYGSGFLPWVIAYYMSWHLYWLGLFELVPLSQDHS